MKIDGVKYVVRRQTAEETRESACAGCAGEADKYVCLNLGWKCLLKTKSVWKPKS